MKAFKLILLLIILSLLTACNSWFDWDWDEGGEYWNEDWLISKNFDGSNIEYIQKYENYTPFLIVDMDNPNEERILLSNYQSIDVMNLDASKRHCIIPDMGSVIQISHDRTKFIYKFRKDYYFANVDGSGQQNITNTPDDESEMYPAFTADDSMIIYAINKSGQHCIVSHDLTTGMEQVLLEKELSESLALKYPIVCNGRIYFGQTSDYDFRNYFYSCSLDGTDTQLISQGDVKHITCSYSLNKVIVTQYIDDYNKVRIFNPETNQYESALEDVHAVDYPIMNYAQSAFLMSDETGYLVYNISDKDFNQLERSNIFPVFNLAGDRVITVQRRFYPDDF
jgi:hypothetical protein